jgi:hypothetical protein
VTSVNLVGAWKVDRFLLPVAEAVMRRSLMLTEDYLGPYHLETARLRNNLAFVMAQQFKQQEALALSDQALDVATQIAAKIQGREIPQMEAWTTWIRQNNAALRKSLGKATHPATETH